MTNNIFSLCVSGWWRHQKETFSALCARNSSVTGEFPSQSPVTRSFDVFFYRRLNKQLRKQSRGWWFETPSHSLWRHWKKWWLPYVGLSHYDDVIMTMLASQITSLTVVYSIVYSGVNQKKHQSSASLAFVREIHRGPVNFPHKWPVTRKMFPFDDVIMRFSQWRLSGFTDCVRSWMAPWQFEVDKFNFVIWNKYKEQPSEGNFTK